MGIAHRYESCAPSCLATSSLKYAAREAGSFWRAMIASMLSWLTVSAPEFHMPSGSGLPFCLACAISFTAR